MALSSLSGSRQWQIIARNWRQTARRRSGGLFSTVFGGVVAAIAWRLK
jgi:hypothetical protein